MEDYEKLYNKQLLKYSRLRNGVLYGLERIVISNYKVDLILD